MDTEESTSVMDDYETLISSTAFTLLKRVQRQEKSAPEILQFKACLVQRIKEHIELAIEKYLFYILKTDEYLNQFSKQEQMFARRCTDDLGRHLDDTVLAKLPDNYQPTLKQSITSEEDDMATLRMIWEFILMRLFCQICWHLPVHIKQSMSEEYNMAWKSQRWSVIYLPSYVTSS